MGLKANQEAYNKPHRHYHNYHHIENVLRSLDVWESAQERALEMDEDNPHREQVLSRYGGLKALSKDERRWLRDAIEYHDIVYEPGASDNEELSAQKFRQWSPHEPKVTKIIEGLIMATKAPFEPKTELEKLMIYLDWSHFSRHDGERLDYINKAIFKEFQSVPFRKYAYYRDSFLGYDAPRVPDKLVGDYVTQNMADDLKEGITQSLLLSKAFRPRIGIYAGSFNPFHDGHAHVVTKAEAVLDKVVIAQIRNPAKNAEIADLPDYYRRYYETHTFEQGISIVDIVKTIERSGNEYRQFALADFFLVRGIRNGADLADEQSLMVHYRNMGLDIPVMHILCDPEFQHISSTAVRNLRAVGFDLYTSK